MKSSDDYIMVFVTAPTAAEAETIATALVETGLAACVNVLPGVRSVYRWEGAVQHDDEVLMIIKSKGSVFADLEKKVLELHSYDVPEVIAVDLTDVSAGYLSFLRDSLNP